VFALIVAELLLPSCYDLILFDWLFLLNESKSMRVFYCGRLQGKTIKILNFRGILVLALIFADLLLG
jgi:hypothetical protein